ncbi:MAG: hypothetical protein EPO39_02430 [Candidatus Manganitrophaceae bacterium]|nr:MAG: hypothetical protein EPO39_02430 [Candidatus Manganitrophaceae bacterium]
MARETRSPSMNRRAPLRSALPAFFLLLFIGQAQADPGELDAGFGGGGKVTTDIGSALSTVYDVDHIEAVSVQPDQKIVAAGNTLDSNFRTDMVVARYLSDGSLDPAFGAGGRVVTGIGAGHDAAAALLIQPDGKILVAGHTYLDATSYDFAIVRYNADGTRDAGFGKGGIVTTNITRDERIASIALQADGKIIAAGYTDNYREYNAVFALVRYQSNGAVDTTFGINGKVTTDIGVGPENISSVLIQEDQKIVAVGTLNGSSFALARYDANGALDPTFGSGGTVFAPISTLYYAYDSVRAAALQPDGKIVVAGSTWYYTSLYGTNYDIVLARFNPNGTFDTAFGNGGRVFTDVGKGTDEFASGLALQGGKILVGGHIFRGSTLTRRKQFDFLLLRYSSDGALDSTFGAGGYTLTDFGAGNDDISAALALQADGKIILAGESFQVETNRNFALARYLSESIAPPDTASPVTLADLSPAPNPIGINNTDVRLMLTASDAAGGSGVKEIRYAIGDGSEVIVPGAAALLELHAEGVSMVRYYAVDRANNAEAPHLRTVRIDKTGPNILSQQSPIPNPSGWNNTNVTVQFEGEDALSGGVECRPAAVPVTTEGDDQSIATVCTDASGNSTAGARAVRIDKSAPLLTLPSFSSSYPLNGTISLSFGASDILSGLSSASATLDGSAVSSGAQVILNRAGLHTFSLTAFDRAGNSAGQSVNFTVGYQFNGFLPPLTAGGDAPVFEIGSTIPVMFQLTDANGSAVSTAVARLSLQRYVEGEPVGPPIEATSFGSINIGNLFHFDGIHYSYSLSTSTLIAGSWQLRAALDDGSVHTIEIRLKAK